MCSCSYKYNYINDIGLLPGQLRLLLDVCDNDTYIVNFIKEVIILEYITSGVETWLVSLTWMTH